MSVFAPDPIRVRLGLIKETDKARWVMVTCEAVFSNGSKEDQPHAIWLPKSHTTLLPSGLLEIPHWLAKRKEEELLIAERKRMPNLTALWIVE